MLAIKLFRAEHIAQCAYISMLNFLPELDDLDAALIGVTKSANALQIVHTIRFDVCGLVGDGLVGERARLMLDIYLLVVERDQILVFFHLQRQLFKIQNKKLRK